MTKEVVPQQADGLPPVRHTTSPIKFPEHYDKLPKTSLVGIRFLATQSPKVIDSITGLDQRQLNSLILRHYEVAGDLVSIEAHREWLVSQSADRLTRLVARFAEAPGPDEALAEDSDPLSIVDSLVHWSKVEPVLRQATGRFSRLMRRSTSKEEEPDIDQASKQLTIPLIDDDFLPWSKVDEMFRRSTAIRLNVIAGAGMDLEPIPRPPIGCATELQIGRIGVSNTIIPDVMGDPVRSDFVFTRL